MDNATSTADVSSDNNNSSDVLFDAPSGGVFQEWKVKVGQSVVIDAPLLLYVDDKKAVHKYKCKQTGTIDWLDVEMKKGDVLNAGQLLARMSACQHPVLMKGMCADCGMDLKEQNEGSAVRAKAKVAMVHHVPELLVDESLAIIHGSKDEENLLKHRKLVLLVDLDQTIIHTTNELVDQKIPDIHHFQLYGAGFPWYHTRFRPHALNFLKTISAKYELHICTFGERMYAHTIAKLLDPDGALFGTRILSRNECFDPMLKTANLKALFPVGDRLVVIIDDRADVWNFKPNVVQVKPYRFFKQTGDIHAPDGFTKTASNTEQHTATTAPTIKDGENKEEQKDKESDKEPSSDEKPNDKEDKTREEDKKAASTAEDATTSESAAKTDAETHEDNDDYLYYLEDILNRLHSSFYKLHDKAQTSQQPQTQPDMNVVVPYVKSKVLSGVRILFSGVIPTNQNPSRTPIYQAARSLGAVVHDNLIVPSKHRHKNAKSTDRNDTDESDTFTTHVVAARWGTSKVHQAARLPYVHIVNPNWLWCCAERWERVDEKLFRLSSTSSLQNEPQIGTPNINHSPQSITRSKHRKHKDETEPSTSAESVKHPMHVHTLLDDFSVDDLRRMSADVDEELGDSDQDQDSTPDDPDPDQDSSNNHHHSDNDDDDDSLSGDTPRGWKRRTADLLVDQDLGNDAGERKRRRDEAELGDGEDDGEDEDHSDESIGSVDDEMAEALDRELADSAR